MKPPFKILVLNYHSISAKGDDALYCIAPNVFLKHLQLIKELNIPVVSTNDLAMPGTIKEGFCVALTFDDGYSSDYDIVFPTLKRLAYTATFFPIVNRVGDEGRLTWDQIVELSRIGTIGSHGLSHKILTQVSLSEQKKELEQSRKIIEGYTEKKVDHFSPPYGSCNKDLVALAKASGYNIIMTTGLRINRPSVEQSLFFRWNITSKTSLDLFGKVLASKGNLPPGLKFMVGLKHTTKKILGPELSDAINRIT